MIIRLPFKRYLQIRIFKLPKRNNDGRFISSESYSEPQPSDNCCVGNYDDIKQASKLENFGR